MATRQPTCIVMRRIIPTVSTPPEGRFQWKDARSQPKPWCMLLRLILQSGDDNISAANRPRHFTDHREATESQRVYEANKSSPVECANQNRSVAWLPHNKADGSITRSIIIILRSFRNLWQACDATLQQPPPVGRGSASVAQDTSARRRLGDF